jgi:hypothetical protein
VARDELLATGNGVSSSLPEYIPLLLVLCELSTVIVPRIANEKTSTEVLILNGRFGILSHRSLLSSFIKSGSEKDFTLGFGEPNRV